MILGRGYLNSAVILQCPILAHLVRLYELIEISDEELLQ